MDPFLSEIRVFSFGFAPRGWAQCNGQLLSVTQNQALFALLGVTYGGNGQTTFGLPNLQGRTPIHTGSTYPLGASFGENAHTLLISEMPMHTHILMDNDSVDAGSNAALAVAGTSVLGKSVAKPTQGGTTPFYPYNSTLSSPTQLSPQALSSYGGSQPHENRQPFLALNVCIALQGVFPSRN